MDDVYLVSERLERVDARELDRLEDELGALPHGYRSYLSRFGLGTYVDLLQIGHPASVLARTNDARETWREYWFWRDNEPLVSQETVGSAIFLGDTTDGDMLVFLPQRPETLFILPRHDDEIVASTGGLACPEHLVTLMLGGKPAFLYFESSTNRHAVELYSDPENHHGFVEVLRVLDDTWGTNGPATIEEDRVLLAFYRAIQGRVQLTRSAPDDPRVGVRVDFDRDTMRRVRRGVGALEHRGFYVTSPNWK